MDKGVDVDWNLLEIGFWNIEKVMDKITLTHTHEHPYTRKQEDT